jgi:hypothetical protein
MVDGREKLAWWRRAELVKKRGEGLASWRHVELMDQRKEGLA